MMSLNMKSYLMRHDGAGLIVVVLLMSTLRYTQAVGTISPLRLGDDTSDNYISLLYSPQGYFLFLKTGFQYLYAENSFCFRLRPIEDIDSSTCQLTNTTGSYDCLTYNVTFSSITKWVLSSDFTTVTNKVSIYSPQARLGSTASTVIIPLQEYDTNTGISFSVLGQSNSIFQMISAGSYTLYRNSDIKYNFVHTFYDSLDFKGSYSDNLIVQRQYQCYRYGKNYDLVFLGGVIHNSAKTYIISFINWNSEKTTFQMWEGLSYSKDHASRDMVGVEPSTGTVTDLFSLYASAPYQDSSVNVGGAQSYTTIISTGQSNSKQSSWFYHTTIYRKYDTGENAGDEIIRFKINNQYCFAAYYDFNLNDISSSDVPLYTSKSFNHQTLQCFTPDLSLFSSFVKLVVFKAILAMTLSWV